MAIELNFSKPDSAAPWGFRLVGGVDFNEPLVVVKVNENSYAEEAGLMVGDVIVRINNSPAAGITHAVAHEMIHSAGCHFAVAVRRGLFSDIPVPSEEENNREVEHILQNSIAERLHDIQKDAEIGQQPKSLKNLAGQEQFVISLENNKVEKRPKNSKKFSTFLVKPKNPKPVLKKLEEERKILGKPYRVEIIKQPKRDPNDVLNHKKSVNFEPNVTEVEISRESSVASFTDSSEKSEFTIEDMELETSIQVAEEITVEICDVIEENVNSNGITNEHWKNQIQNNEEAEQNSINKIPKPILKQSSLDIHIDPVICESSLSLEEQLAAVQKQLLALSQLPSAIQVTLEAVTQQLNKIVLDKIKQSDDIEQPENEENENGNESINGSEGTVEEELPNENLSVSENAEGDITENEMEDNQILEELDVDQKHEDIYNQNIDDSVQLGEEDSDKNVDPYAGLSEEEKEAKMKEEILLVKKQKIEEEKRKMDWTQRPIVLPGGRKWSDPDDASPKPKNPKMSDEKISKTIDGYSEILVGKTKGINFLKYQPPPKNLDYLQKSEVYRLIHGMEAPARGVGARAEKILSEKDYYKDKEALQKF